MLSQLLTIPPPLDIKKYHTDDYPLTSKLDSSTVPFYTNISHLVSAPMSSGHSSSPANSVDDDLPSPRSPTGGSVIFGHGNPSSESLNPTTPPPSVYQTTSESVHIRDSFNSQPSAHDAYNINASSDSHRHLSFPFPSSAPHSQDRFFHSTAASYPAPEDRSSSHLDDRCSRESLENKYNTSNTTSHNPNFERRMSEPPALGCTNMYAAQAVETHASNRYQQFAYNLSPLVAPRSSYPPSLQRGVSLNSLRDIRDQGLDYHVPQLVPAWKDDYPRHKDHFATYDPSTGFEEPLSPLQPNFTGGILNSPHSIPYSPTNDSFYGPSPPTTGTSTASSIGQIESLSQAFSRGDNDLDPANSKTYSFVALPGNSVKKRPRRRYDEIERLYQCSWPECNKAYGTLNHLNAHVTMQKHGPKRSPNEFKELRKQWRKAKKECESPGPMRRSSMTSPPDVHDLYDASAFRSSRHSLRRPHSSHQVGMLPMSVSIPQHGSHERYSVDINEIRYPIHDREDNYGQMTARQRYNSNSWQIPPASTRTHMQSSFPSVNHNNHLPSLPPLPSDESQVYEAPRGHRLPNNSSLFTSLPSYQASLLPPLQVSAEFAYSAEGVFDIYEDQSNGRPGTGQSFGSGSADGYDH